MGKKWYYTWESRFDEDQDEKQRILLHFGKYNIENMVYLGKSMNIEAHRPIGEHVHLDAFEITYHTSGSQVLILDEQQYDVGAGDILISFPGEVHKTGEFVEEISSYYFFSFVCAPNASSFLGLDKDAARYLVKGLYDIQKRQFQATPNLKWLLDEIIKTYGSESPMRRSRIQYLFAEVLLNIILLSNGSEEHKEIPEDIADIIEYIDSNAGYNITLVEIALRMGLSVNQLKHQFKKYVRMPPHNYLLRKKTQLAKDMLRYTQLSLTDIAYQLGFSSSQHFSMVFKKYEFLTPSQYRKSIQHK